MFFRHEKPHIDTFQERLDALKKYGIATENEGTGKIRAHRNGIGAIVTDLPNQCPHVTKAGLIMGSETGALVNGGYQQFWLTPSRKRAPALAGQLRELHQFEEDLKEGLGLSSLYNTSLGTTSALHLYDRLEERDETKRDPKPWEIKLSK